MLSQLQELLNVYLFPFVIAVPIAIVLYLLITRRDDAPPPPPPRPASPQQRPAADVRPQRPPAAAARTTTAPTAPPPAAFVAPELATTQFGDTEAAPAWSNTLLLVDDSAVARAKLRKLFETAGYSVALAKDGVEALQMLGQERFALMITDLEMPNMNGVELIAAVNGSLDNEDMPILAITGHDDLQAKVHECQGLFGIFKKPWNDRELLRRVEALVKLKNPALARSDGMLPAG